MKIIISILLLVSLGCKTNNKAMQTSNETRTDFVPVFASGPPVLVYKTKANYNNLVPVILSDDKTEIVSYPHPKDLIKGSGFPLPFILNDGYLLDERGIGKNVAFLKMTYEEYSKLENEPSIIALYDNIVDKDPLTELCDCGVRTAFTDEKKQLNNLIDDKKIRTTCKVIK
jgi:hypothetical protein